MQNNQESMAQKAIYIKNAFDWFETCVYTYDEFLDGEMIYCAVWKADETFWR